MIDSVANVDFLRFPVFVTILRKPVLEVDKKCILIEFKVLLKSRIVVLINRGKRSRFCIVKSNIMHVLAPSTCADVHFLPVLSS